MSAAEHRADATPFLPERKSLKALREAAAKCRACHLYANATQTVFGEGRRTADLHFKFEERGKRRAFTEDLRTALAKLP